MDTEFKLYQGENDFFVNTKVKAIFDEHGYIIVRDLLTQKEVSKLKEYAENDSDINKYAYEVEDGKGGKSRLCIWNHPGNDISGKIIRCQKISGTAQALLGGDEIYHYSTKLMMKEPHTGGSFVWHQDYGYFYQNGCIYPEMLAVFMPIDRSIKKNGCLQVLKGSHRLGRINHVLSGEQAGAEPDILDAAISQFPLEYVEMEPGDVLFFHCNLLHSSSKNESEMRRWVMIRKLNSIFVKYYRC